MCIGVRLCARFVARAAAVVAFALIAANCSPAITGFSESLLLDDGSQNFPVEVTGAVKDAKVAPIGRKPQLAGIQTLPAPVESRIDESIDPSITRHVKPRVLLLRGLFGVFSGGLDALAEELRADGIDADVVGHQSWYTAARDILQARATGNTGPLVLVGHSQGANNVIAVARLLRHYNIRVDLLVTLAPVLPQPIPYNVVRVINYYQFPGWGSPIAPDRGFAGKLSNINIIGDLTTFHMTIDKNSGIRKAIAREILAL